MEIVQSQKMRYHGAGIDGLSQDASLRDFLPFCLSCGLAPEGCFDGCERAPYGVRSYPSMKPEWGKGSVGGAR